MKLVATVFANRRAALPHLFCKYSLPAMRRSWQGELSAYIIHHDEAVPGQQLHSNRSGPGSIENVRRFRDEGRYAGATFLQHRVHNRELPLLPSFALGCKLALGEDADFHLWLEDDAIVHDDSCGGWPAAFREAGADVGLYRDTWGKRMINCAYFVSTPRFDRRVLPDIESYRKDDWRKYVSVGSQLEHLLWSRARCPARLNDADAARHHPYASHRCTGRQVADWLPRRVPGIRAEDVALLSLDFDD